jgi:hypothetical protein
MVQKPIEQRDKNLRDIQGMAPKHACLWAREKQKGQSLFKLQPFTSLRKLLFDQ